MSIIRFKTRIELGFFRGGAAAGFRVFEPTEYLEFSISATPHGGCTLTAEDGSEAPFVGRESFEVLPEDFTLYRFTRSVRLMFGIYEYAIDRWIYDIGSRLYSKGSVHAFRTFHGAPIPHDSVHLQNLDGQILPEIHAGLVEKVNSSSSPKSPDKPSKRVLESFPAPVPGIVRSSNTWELPSSFNSLRVVRDAEVRCSLYDCSDTPVAYLRLVEGDGRRYDKLYYRCSFFGVPKV